MEVTVNLTKTLAAAHARALASGHPVVIARDGVVLRMFPDRSEEVLKYIEKPTKVELGFYGIPPSLNS